MTKIYIKKLKSQMTVILIPMKNVPIVSAGVFVRVGSFNETSDNNGIAHFLEHMMFKGTKKRKGNKIAKELDSKGAHYNAATSKEYTYYYINGNSTDTNLFIEILADLYCNPSFNEQDIKMERNVILEEFDMGLDNSENTLMEIVHNKVFPYSPLNLPVIGDKKCIMKLKKHDFVDFRKAHYVLKNTSFVIAGDFNKERVIKKIVKEFCSSHIEKEPNVEYPLVIRRVVEQKAPYIHITEKPDISQTHVMFVFRPQHDSEEFELELISDMLSSGLSSKLFDLLRNKNGITYFNYSYNISYATDRVFIIHIGVNNLKIYKAIKIILSALQDLVKHGITEGDLSKIKTIKQTSFKLGFLEPRHYMRYYGITSLFSNISSKNDPIKNFHSSLQNTTRKNINDTIKSLFVSNQLNLFIYGYTKDVAKKLEQLNKLIHKSLL